MVGPRKTQGQNTVNIVIAGQVDQVLRIVEAELSVQLRRRPPEEGDAVVPVD